MTLQTDILRSRNAAHIRRKLAEARGTIVTEKALHKAVAQFLSLALTPPDFFTTFPLGGGGKARGGQLRSVGTKAGIPDILLIRNGRVYWIELKTSRGTLSEQQKATGIDLRAAGSSWCVCRSVEEVEQRLIEWGFQLKAHFTREAA